VVFSLSGCGTFGDGCPCDPPLGGFRLLRYTEKIASASAAD